MIDYSIINTEADHVAVRGKVTSFNLDHITDKDLSSFFVSLSKYAHIDTGLLPLDGTGLLAYRQAANHAQIVVQHAPSVSRILWGEHEGDSNANVYHLAQPYRIIIGDILNGNFYGARIFYSINPITSPSQELYHVNLPNINCKGYRGNGVGWVCLYHRDDWTQIPLGEKVSRLIERCSGSEAYNDANMSETDGPRFYESFGKPNYTWNPKLWEKKTQEEGINWTLQQDLWIPILVKDRDNQGGHFNNGIPLTLGIALTGDYQAYYTDNLHTKPVNSIARNDKEYSSLEAFTLIKQAYTEAPQINKTENFMNPYMHAEQLREQYASTISGFSQNNNEENDSDDEEFFTCHSCEDTHSLSDTDSFSDKNGYTHCQGCFDEYFVYCEFHEVHEHIDDTTYVEEYQTHIPTEEITCCSSCANAFYLGVNNQEKYHHYKIFNNNSTGLYDVCTECLPHSSGIDYVECSYFDCKHNLIILSSEYQNQYNFYHSIKYIDHYLQNEDMPSSFVQKYYHSNSCYQKAMPTSTVCPCGNIRENPESLDVTFIDCIENKTMDHIDPSAYMPLGGVEFFNPLVKIANYNNITLTEDEQKNFTLYSSACKSCVCIDNSGCPAFDPSKFDVNNFDNLKQVMTYKNSQEGI